MKRIKLLMTSQTARTNHAGKIRSRKKKAAKKITVRKNGFFQKIKIKNIRAAREDRKLKRWQFLI